MSRTFVILLLVPTSAPSALSSSLCRQIAAESRCPALAGLAELDLTGCRELGALPRDLGALGRLTRLDCDGCARLAALPSSVTRLSRLRVLNLRGCTALTVLPADLLEALAGAPCGSAHRHEAKGNAAAAAGCRPHDRDLPDPASPLSEPGRHDSAALDRAGGISESGIAFTPPIRQASSFGGISSVDDDVVIMDETRLPSAQSRGVNGEPGGINPLVFADAPAATAGWEAACQPTSADGTAVVTAAACPPAAEAEQPEPAETVLTGLTQINTNGCAALERPPALATAAAVLYCRQLAVRFPPPHAASQNGGSASEVAERDQGLKSWLKPQSSPITDACQDILRLEL